MKLDLKDNIILPKNNLLNLEEIDENDKEENFNQKEDDNENMHTQIGDIITYKKLDLRESITSSQNENDIKSSKSNNTKSGRISESKENEKEKSHKSSKSREKSKSIKSIKSNNTINKMKENTNDEEEEHKNMNDNIDNNNIEENNSNLQHSHNSNINKNKSKENNSVDRILSETKSRNKIIEKSYNISDKNKYLIKELLNLLDQKDFGKAKDLENDNKFLKTLKELNETERKKIFELYKKGKRIFQFNFNQKINNNNLNKGNINRSYERQNKNRPKTIEELYQNIKYYYMPFMNSNEKMKFNENKYISECIEEIYLPLKISDNNDNKGKKNMNTLFNSYDKIYKIKGKNKSGYLNERNNNYNSYNYNMILNSIDDRLQSLKIKKMDSPKLALYKYNFNTDLKKKKEYNIFSINYNPKNDNKIYNRDIKMNNTFEEIKNGINSIQIGNISSKREDKLLRIF